MLEEEELDFISCNSKIYKTLSYNPRLCKEISALKFSRMGKVSIPNIFGYDWCGRKTVCHFVSGY